jgi:hypothetical protein
MEHNMERILLLFYENKNDDQTELKDDVKIIAVLI